MANPLRLLITSLAGLLCAGLLRADSGHWGFDAGGVKPLGSSKQWIGSGAGPAVDLLVAYPLDSGGTVRMRMGWLAFKANGQAPQTLALPGSTPASYPAVGNNTLWALTYGVEYLHDLHQHGLYLLGGAGAAYLSATRDGTITLPAPTGPAVFHYATNNLVPYVCLGVGLRFNATLALEGRYQWSEMRDQVRGVDLSQAGVTAPATASFSGFNASTLGLGLVVSF